jgi:MATE family multidrug resistance protein
MDAIVGQTPPDRNITEPVQDVIREAKGTLRLAVPITIGQLSQMLMGVVDSMMIGRAGTVPLAASSFGGSVFNIFFIIGLGILTPVAILSSRSIGAKRHDEAGEYLRHGLLLGLVAGVVQVAIILFISTRLGHFGQTPEVLAAVNPFFLLIGFSLLPALGYLSLRQFAESMGRPWVSVVVILAGVILNIFLNWVFIYGNLGSRAFGLAGAGIATLIARSAGSVVLFLWLRSDPHMRAAWPRRWLAPFSAARIREMMAIGLPASGSLLFETGMFAFVTIMVGWLGSVPLASHQIAISCCAVTFMLPLGVAIAVGMRTSVALGAGEGHRILPIWTGANLLGGSVAFVIVLAFVFFGRGVASLFTTDPEVISTAAALLGVAAVFQVFDASQVISSCALRGISDVKVPAAVTFAAYWLVAVPVAYFVGIRLHRGAVGVWSGLAAGILVSATLLGFRFVRLARERAKAA